MDPRERINDYQDSFQAAFSGQQAGIWTALPAIVSKVDLTKATLEATPAVQAYVYAKDGTPSLVTMPTLLDVPIHFPRGGGYVATFPIKPGDEVLVVFACRNIDSWWQQGDVQPPLTSRFHDLSDGFAIPGVYSQKTVPAGISDTTARLTSEDELNYVEIDKDGGLVNVVAKNEITLTAPKVTVNANQKVTVTTPYYSLSASNLATVETPSWDVQASEIAALNAPNVELNGNSAVTMNTPGAIVSGILNISNSLGVPTSLGVVGSAYLNGDVTLGSGVTLGSHIHPGVQNGLGTTGSPQG